VVLVVAVAGGGCLPDLTGLSAITPLDDLSLLERSKSMSIKEPLVLGDQVLQFAESALDDFPPAVVIQFPGVLEEPVR
jgi:hypothetical protein